MARVGKKKLRDLLKIYFITGSINCLKAPEEVLREAIKGGITIFQFREKGSGSLTGEEMLLLGRKLLHICQENHIPFIVNDDIDLALALDADGVHIGQGDANAEEVRKMVGDRILGVSVHSEKEARAAILAGADYFGIGPVFSTISKEDAEPARGTFLIEELRSKGYDTPIVGIGGINIHNASTVMKAGADGVSVISAISRAANITMAAQQLRKQVMLEI